MQAKLPLWPRLHDLPPRWNGLPVEWGGWSEQPNICPPPKPQKCKRCGSKRDRLVNLGRIWRDFTAVANVSSIGRARLKNDKQLVANIAAFRCPDCGHDYMLDGIDADAEAWDLDETDYTDEGSWDVERGKG